MKYQTSKIIYNFLYICGIAGKEIYESFAKIIYRWNACFYNDPPGVRLTCRKDYCQGK